MQVQPQELPRLGRLYWDMSHDRKRGFNQSVRPEVILPSLTTGRSNLKSMLLAERKRQYFIKTLTIARHINFCQLSVSSSAQTLSLVASFRPALLFRDFEAP